MKKILFLFVLSLFVTNLSFKNLFAQTITEQNKNFENFQQRNLLNDDIDSDIQLILEKQKLSPNHHYELAIRFIKQENYSEALKSINKAIALDPYSFDKYNKRAFINYKLNQKALAYADIDKAIKLNPENPESYSLRGLFKLNHQQFGEAKKDYKKAKKLRRKLKKRQEKIDKKTKRIS